MSKVGAANEHFGLIIRIVIEPYSVDPRFVTNSARYHWATVDRVTTCGSHRHHYRDNKETVVVSRGEEEAGERERERKVTGIGLWRHQTCV